MKLRPLIALLLTAGLAGCAEREFPLTRPAAADAACVPPQLPAADLGDPIPGFGCATEANLRAMLVNPADLEAGAPATSAPSGDAAIAPAARHRLGQVKTGQPAGAQAPDLVVRTEGK
jgi:type IV pilus biogenesis protein CpaD/CtpE